MQQGRGGAAGQSEPRSLFLRPENAFPFKGNQARIRFVPLSFNERAQLACAHDYPMSIDFGLQS